MIGWGVCSRLFLVAVILLVSLGAAPTYAQNPDSKTKKDSASSQSKAPPNAFSKPYGYYLNPMLDHIQASSDQRTKITVIVQNYRGSIEPLRLEYNARQQDFLSNVVKGQPSAQIMEQQMRLSQMYEEITSHYCRMSLEVRRVLNPDQIVRYEEFKRKRGWTRSQGK